MRTFHTYTNACGGAYGEHAGAIGRLHSPCAYTSATTDKSTGNLKAHALTYSGETSTDLMVKSLEDGLCYVRRQITGLSDTGFIIKELLLSLPGRNRHRLPNFLNTLKSRLCKSIMPRSRPDVPV
jgi:hypothetical protein